MLSPQKIALIGGLSWHSTKLYYTQLNTLYQQRKGHNHSAPLLLNSLDFQEVLHGLKKANRKDLLLALQTEIEAMQAFSCHPVLITSNTAHVLYDDLQAAFPELHWLHIADSLGHYCATQGIHKLGLLGTRFTLQQAFYRERLSNKFDLELLIPKSNLKQLHHIITHELTQGVVQASSQQLGQQICHDLHQRGAQAIALACTELSLLLQAKHSPVPLLDTVALHCHDAIECYLQKTPS